MPHDKTQSYFFLTLLIVVFALMYFILKPFIVVMALSATVAVIAEPLYTRLKKRYGDREVLASFSTIVIFLVCLFIPLVIVILTIIGEAKGLYQSLGTDTPITQQAFSTLQNKVHVFFPNATIDIHQYTKQFIDWLIANTGAFFTGTIDFVFKIFVALVALFYFLKDGEKFKEHIALFSPLADEYDRMIFDTLAKTIRSVVIGSLTVSLIQGVLSGIGLAIFGVPNPVLWGAVAAVSALIPGVGTSLVLVPAIFYAFFFGAPFMWIGLLIWSLLAVGLIDNFLGPKLIERGVHIHPLLILFSVLGGVSFFGPEGFILGPLVLSLLFALIKINKKIWHS